jgi:hypothetical protein
MGWKQGQDFSASSGWLNPLPVFADQIHEAIHGLGFRMLNFTAVLPT